MYRVKKRISRRLTKSRTRRLNRSKSKSINKSRKRTWRLNRSKNKSKSRNRRVRRRLKRSKNKRRNRKTHRGGFVSSGQNLESFTNLQSNAFLPCNLGELSEGDKMEQIMIAKGCEGKGAKCLDNKIGDDDIKVLKGRMTPGSPKETPSDTFAEYGQSGCGNMPGSIGKNQCMYGDGSVDGFVAGVCDKRLAGFNEMNLKRRISEQKLSKQEAVKAFKDRLGDDYKKSGRTDSSGKPIWVHKSGEETENTKNFTKWREIKDDINDKVTNSAGGIVTMPADLKKWFKEWNGKP